jgi:hypothetical protein
MIFKSAGKIIYAPQTHLNSSTNWAIVSCDDEISKYYRHLYIKQYPYLNGDMTGKLTRPVWGAHISFIRHEKISDSSLWKMFDGKIITFEYTPGVLDNGEYFWMKVKCPFLLDLREKLGLSRNPKFGLHLTIGRVS